MCISIQTCLFKSCRWNKLVQKPYEAGDERGLKLVQSILKPIMLRRTKLSTDREGRQVFFLSVQYCPFDLSVYLNVIVVTGQFQFFLKPIFKLYTVNLQKLKRTSMMHYSKNRRYSIFLVFTAKFKTSMALHILRLSLNFLCNVYFLPIPLGSTFWLPFQVKFDQFVEQGRVLHNYASILELLLRLRQCCDHPFLVMRYAKNPCSNAFTFFFLLYYSPAVLFIVSQDL